jgi:hypothetical protein
VSERVSEGADLPFAGARSRAFAKRSDGVSHLHQVARQLVGRERLGAFCHHGGEDHLTHPTAGEGLVAAAELLAPAARADAGPLPLRDHHVAARLVVLGFRGAVGVAARAGLPGGAGGVCRGVQGVVAVRRREVVVRLLRSVCGAGRGKGGGGTCERLEGGRVRDTHLCTTQRSAGTSSSRPFRQRSSMPV